MTPQPKPTEVADYSTRKNYQSNYAKQNRDAINQRKRAWRATRKAIMNETPHTEVGTVTSRQITYSVIGNHPIHARPDKTFKTFNEAVEYSVELIKHGFDGVAIMENFACLESVDATTASDKPKTE